jgi:very-short-patch-repair endonuclease
MARTLADLAHCLDDQSLHRVIREAHFKGLFDDDKVRDALTRRPARRLKEYLGDATLTQSELEDAFLRLCRRHGIPAPVTQYGSNPRVDFIWHDARLIVEVDGWKAHRTRTRTRTRRPRLVAAQLSAARGGRR